MTKYFVRGKTFTPFLIPEMGVTVTNRSSLWIASNIFSKYKDLLLVLQVKEEFDPLPPSAIALNDVLPSESPPPSVPEIAPVNATIKTRITNVLTNPTLSSPIVTFVWCVKNRSEQLIESLHTIVTEKNARLIDFVVVEDISKRTIDLSTCSSTVRRHVTHSIVTTGNVWNRSKLLNYGFKNAKTPLVAAVDVDFLFPEHFMRTYLSLIRETDFSNAYLWISTTETGEGLRRGCEFKRYDLYGGFYTYSKQNVETLGGYDESFEDYGHEERDFNWRHSTHFNTAPARCELAHIVYHKSHDDAVRGVTNNTGDNLVRMKIHKQSNTTALEQSWGDVAVYDIKNAADRDTLVVIGNGPSLKEVNLEAVSDRFATIAMNGIYRYCYRTGWWPHYFCCFDRVVTECHAAEWKKMIEDENAKIAKYFMLQRISDSEKLTVLSPAGSLYTFSTSFDTFGNGGCSGANAVQVGMCLGYKKFILLGIDAKYVQLVEGAQSTHRPGRPNELVITSTPTTNPNYFFDDYQQTGDKYNVPNEHIFHVPAWKSLARFAEMRGINIINCSMQSALDCFPKKPLSEVMA